MGSFSLQVSPTPLRKFLSLPAFYPPPRSCSSFSMTTAMPVKQPPNALPNPFLSDLPEMPLEVILSIMEVACSDGDRQQHIPLLLSCSLVCKTWSAAAQRLLFSQVTLRSHSTFQLFINAVDRTTPHGRMLSDAVKELRVVLDHNQPSGLHHHSFAVAVTFCPNLSHLAISLYGCAEPGEDVVGEPDVSRLRRLAPSFDDHTISLLKSGPKIHFLHFNNWSENQESIFQLLDIYPSLQHLSIGGTTPLQPRETLLPFPCALKSLSLKFQTTPPIEFMRWLLHNSSASLRALDCDRDPYADTLSYLMTTFGPQLESISMPGLLSPDYAAMMSKCSRLRHLRTENPSLPAIFYKSLPLSLEHMSLSLDHDTPLNAVIDLIMAHETLQTVKVFLWDGGRKHPLLSPLRIACTYRGINLTMTNDLNGFRSEINNVSLVLILIGNTN